MLKDHITINHMIQILHELKGGDIATSQELCHRLVCDKPAYLRKILTRMSKAGLLISCGMEGYRQYKPFADTTLGDVLMASEPMALQPSPASRAEDKLNELAAQILVADLI